MLQTLSLAGQEYVVIAKSDYETQRQQDWCLARISRSDYECVGGSRRYLAVLFVRH